MNGDISKKTVIILVIITIIISIFSTFLVLNNISNIKLESQESATPAQETGGPVSSASVSIDIQKPPVTQGSVSVTILPKGN